MLDLVLGISGTGKSTYIANRLLPDRPNAQVVMGNEIGDGFDASNSIVHYNLLRPFENSADHYDRPIDHDVVIHRIVRDGAQIRATMLVCTPATLIRRTLLRDQIEPILRRSGGRYPTREIFEFLCRIPIVDVYRRWIEWLDARGIRCSFVSTDGSYSEVDEKSAFAILSDDTSPVFSLSERAAILKKFSFPYQGIEGRSRPATLDIILPHIAGQTALDIGCGEGHFCFALEKMGFTRVVGTEIKKDRFLAANAMKYTTGSRSEFRLSESIPSGERFDTILILNVVHHLKEPIGTIRAAAAICNDVTIIEFPTLSDRKFKTTIARQTIPDNLPLIGVSMISSQDQTFVFSAEAIRRICTDHDKLFSSVKFLSSPISDRFIAICRK